MSQIETKYTDPLRRDALEAFHLTCSVRNGLFILLLMSLLALGGAFWLTDIARWQNQCSCPTTAGESIDIPVPDEARQEMAKPLDDTENISVNDEPHVLPIEATPPAEEAASRSDQWREQLVPVLITLGRFGAFFTSILYLLSLLLMLNLVIVGRLGGAASLAKAFFLMLLAMVLMVPWRSLAVINVPGTLFRHDQLLAVQCGLTTTSDLFCYYLHFVGLWVSVMLLVLAAQWRSRKGVKTVKRQQSPVMAPNIAYVRSELGPTPEPIPLEPPRPQANNSNS